MPFRSNLFSVVIAGWALSYLKVNYQYTEHSVESMIKGEKINSSNNFGETVERQEDIQNGWAYQLRKTLRECKRILKDNGLIVILESRGVAYDEPTRDGILIIMLY